MIARFLFRFLRGPCLILHDHRHGRARPSRIPVYNITRRKSLGLFTGIGGRLLAVLCCGLWWGVLQAQEPERKERRPAAPPAKSSSWTYDEALGQLRLYPRDPYLQFVVLQLGQREGRTQEAADAIRRLRPDIDRRMERTQEVDLFSLFSGALDDANLLALFTCSGGEVVQDTGEPLPSQRRGGFWLYGLSEIGLPERDLYDLVTKGLSDKISLHTYDADQFFDFQLMGFLGRMVGSFSGRQGFGMGNEFLPIVFLGASLNSPVYVSVPLDDTQVVDSFLEKLDVSLADLVRHSAKGGFIPLEQDFYRLPLAGDVSARSFGLQVGPIKWRFFWARLGKTLYVASKPYILEDLAANLAGADAAETSAGDLSDQKAHAMIRIRPEHWQQVLPNYRLGWAERHRHSCLENVGRLSNVARMVHASTSAEGGVDGQVAAFESAARQLYGLHFFCPEGGQYVPDGKGVRCSHHGSALDPHQAAVPQDNAAIDTMLREFSGLTVTLTFLEDGLYAVLLIDH